MITEKLFLNTENNFNPEYSLTTRLNDEIILPKTGYKKIDYNGILSVDSYDLAQNFPNPFNPSTIIKYQIPENGIVTIKIYDILGKEVRTLINEEKVMGRYEINFDATGLASGIYIYSIQVNDYVSSKKMILLR